MSPGGRGPAYAERARGRHLFKVLRKIPTSGERFAASNLTTAPLQHIRSLVCAGSHKFSSSVMSGSLQSMFGVLHRLDLGLTSHPNDAALPLE